MADNVAITAGSGTTLAADDLSGVLYPRAKLSLGDDGTAVDAVGGSGVNGTNVQRVTIATNDTLVASLATKLDTLHTDVTAATPAGTNLMGKVGIDQTTPGTTNAVAPISGQAGIAGGSGVAGATVVRVTQATDDIVPAIAAAGIATCSTDITRPADTTAYAANDNLSDSTSSPTSGGFTLTGVARASGKSAIITDLVVTSSNSAGGLSGEVWLFDSSVTNINDNSAFAISDSEVKTVVGIIPFTLVADTNNSQACIPNIMIGVTTVGSANLRYLIKVKAAYTPISAEVITVRAKCLQIN